MFKLVTIPPNELPNMIGKAVHLSWAKVGCVWILDSIEGNMAILHTPSTYKTTTQPISNICYTRKHRPKANQ